MDRATSCRVLRADLHILDHGQPATETFLYPVRRTPVWVSGSIELNESVVTHFPMADSLHPLSKARSPKDEDMNRDENNPAPLSSSPNESTTSRNRRFSTSAVPSPTLTSRRQVQKRSSGEFVRRVSFDTMTHQDMPNYSFTLQEKSSGWERTQKTRVFMLATDLESHSREALKYTTEVKLQACQYGQSQVEYLMENRFVSTAAVRRRRRDSCCPCRGHSSAQ